MKRFILAAALLAPFAAFAAPDTTFAEGHARPVISGEVDIFIGINAGEMVTTGSRLVFIGDWVGSKATTESDLLIVRVSGNRLLRCDTKAESCAFMPYSDEAAMSLEHGE